MTISNAYETDRERDIERLKRLRPIDDDFMRCLFRDNIPLVQHVLRLLTNINDLEIISVETQADMKRLAGARSICLDAYGTDRSGKKYDLEIQRSDKGAGKHRARYHSSVMDVENLNVGQDFSDLPETYVIFVTENDVFGDGQAVYPIERMNLARNELFYDGEHILYVNGAYRGEDEIGKLMHDFSCNNPANMYNQDLAEITRYYKESKEGVESMCKELEEMRNEYGIKTYIEACKEFGITDKNEIIRRLMAKFSFLTEAQAEAYVSND